MESVKHHLEEALVSIKKVKSIKPRSRSGSPIRSERKETMPLKKKEKKIKEPKEKPAKIHVCREKKTGLYKKCKEPKKK